MAREDVRPLAWVTGATSFLGRHAALALARQGYDVAGLARTVDAEAELKARWGFRFIECGLFDDALLRRLQERTGPPVFVFHAIGSGSVGQADSDPVADYERTIQTTVCLLEHLGQAAPRARFIYPSSAAVYGTTTAGPISEYARTEPMSVYGANKLRVEAICREYAAHNGQSTGIIRFFSVYGPPQRKLLFWDIGQRILAGEQKITLGGTGEETRDLINVRDAAAIVALLSTAKELPAIINAGSGRATSVKTLVVMLARALGIGAEFHFDGHARPGNPPYQQADIALLGRLGFGFSIPLERGLAEYASWLGSSNAVSDRDGL